MADEIITNSETEEMAESQTEGIEMESDDDDASWDAVTWDGTEESEDSLDETGESDAEEIEDEQPEPESHEPDTADTQPDTDTGDTDQFLEIKYMGEGKKISKEEAITLSQKGMDYDRVRQERDSMNADYQTLKGYESFLNELKGDFPSIDALIADTRARLLSDKEGISYADAMAKVKNLHPEQDKPAQRENQTQGNEAVQRFVERYPNVKAEEIPESVWEEVRNGGDLTASYAKYESSKKDNRIAELEKEIQTLKQNSKNAARSSGSANTAGKTSAKSLIQKLWEDDDY